MSGRKIYMDHAATTPLREEVLSEMLPYLRECFGNPSSIYSMGREVRKALVRARERTAEALGASPEEVVFTSGGTESNNIAIRGALKHRGGTGHLIASGIEHPAVMDVFKELSTEGYDVTFLPVDRYGMIDIGELERALREDTVLISIMMANNEVGTLQPVEDVGKIAAERNIIFHTDAVQATGNIPVDVRKIDCDSLSLSAHKFNGPKGVGALYINRRLKVSPLYRGGGQEGRIRPGTENVPGIVGLGKALELSVQDLPSRMKELAELRDCLIRGLVALDEVDLNGHPTERLPGNVNVCFKYVEGEAILLGLDLQGVAVSSGSACASEDAEPSYVLRAMGLDHMSARGSIRFSLGRGNTPDDVEYVLGIVKPMLERFRKMSAAYIRPR
ncbi:MAG: IscS subfamily cysteine desulfurase [Firmicutes bacterium]|jgi:cysteine desulfurase|nr:IscS subfamily cysteine desulfurase [Bacillota bacterium]